MYFAALQLTFLAKFIFRFEIGDAYLGAVSRFMSNAFEYGDALLPRPEGANADDETPHIESNQPYINLATYAVQYSVLVFDSYSPRFRMVVLADEILESFFETDFTATFRLESVPMMDLPANHGLLGDLWTQITSEDNKKIFNKLTDGVGRAVGKHQVFHRPAIGKITALEEPKARESLLTPTMRRAASKADLKSPTDETSAFPPSSASAPADLSGPAQAEKSPEELPPRPGMFEAAASAAAAFMERTPFAIDDAKDDDEDSEEEDEIVEDDVMDEVCCTCVSPMWPR